MKKNIVSNPVIIKIQPVIVLLVMSALDGAFSSPSGVLGIISAPNNQLHNIYSAFQSQISSLRPILFDIVGLHNTIP